ncbi:hypothetical protein BX666DRAFT_1998312 [Dichotomocladium elegans]|nr:hypothetical protein BX666DRAFT_1998312 [Dichotomocladium elegans]
MVYHFSSRRSRMQMTMLIFLSHPQELRVLLELLPLYNRESNAKLNNAKTIALSLSGRRLDLGFIPFSSMASLIGGTIATTMP